MDNKDINNYFETPTALNKQLAVLSMTNFIYKIINKYANSNNREDLMQQGYLGVLKALSTWDKNKGAFTTHAYYQIFDQVMQYIKNNTDHNLERDHISTDKNEESRWYNTFIDIDRRLDKFTNDQINQFLLSIQGYSNEEIAPKFKLGKTGVWWNVSKIKEYLINCLEM